MSEDKPGTPWDPFGQPQQETPAEPGRGSMVLGILLGALALYALYFGTTSGIAPDEGYRTFLAGPAAFIPIAVYLALAIMLTVRPRTSRWGTGLLIGLGVFTLVGGGLCVAILAQMRGVV